MRIAQVAPPFESVPPTRYGGTERVIATLTEELVRRGHEVTLFASSDSQTSARLVPVLEKPLWHQRPPYADFAPFWTMVLGQLATQLDQFDIVHSHLDYWAYPLARVAPCPIVTTHHGRLDPRELQQIHEEFTDVPLVSISDAQRQPSPHANWVATVYHGIELDEFTFNPQRGEYLAFLGRISPEKGVETAIRVARRAGLPIKIAARKPLPYNQDPSVRRDWEYYENEVQPLLQGRQVELIGQVNGEEKDELLRNAAALLFPIRWPEPFGLVMAEALACGTPVLALRNGSVPEVLEHGVTGFICETEDELVEAVGRLDEIDRARCRSEAMRRFSPALMADRYEQVYEHLIRWHRATPNGHGTSARRAPTLGSADGWEQVHA
ncbi:MAG TPA: glycosyltransferase family 4 protein [Chloroflexota bacterium]|nr:glycosyltransferase family 4 protein [Chloroflexota bacterium]